MACIPVYKGKRFPSTEKLLEYLSTDEGIMDHLSDGKDTEFLKAIEDAVAIPEKTPQPVLAEEVAPAPAEEEVKFTTHTGEVVSGERLQKALNKVADDFAENARLERSEDKYASQVSEEQKDQRLQEKLALAEGVRNGVGLENLTVQQRVNAELTGETVPIIQANQQQTNDLSDVRDTDVPQSNSSPFTAFDPPSESMSREQGRKARAALKEAVGPEQFKRMENLHKNKEKVLEGLQSRKIIEVVCP